MLAPADARRRREHLARAVGARTGLPRRAPRTSRSPRRASTRDARRPRRPGIAVAARKRGRESCRFCNRHLPRAAVHAFGPGAPCSRSSGRVACAVLGGDPCLAAVDPSRPVWLDSPRCASRLSYPASSRRSRPRPWRSLRHRGRMSGSGTTSLRPSRRPSIVAWRWSPCEVASSASAVSLARSAHPWRRCASCPRCAGSRASISGSTPTPTAGRARILPFDRSAWIAWATHPECGRRAFAHLPRISGTSRGDCSHPRPTSGVDRVGAPVLVRGERSDIPGVACIGT